MQSYRGRECLGKLVCKDRDVKKCRVMEGSVAGHCEGAFDSRLGE